MEIFDRLTKNDSFEKNLNYYKTVNTDQYILEYLLKLDYEKMKENNSIFTEELVSKVFNPNRLLKLCSLYNLTFEEINDFY